MNIKYPLANSPIDKDDINYLIKWLETNPRLTMGPVTKEFEQRWAKFIGTKNSVFVNSGSSANLLMVYCAIVNGNLSAGDKVIVPSCGWVTSVAPLIQLGLEPIMVDADKNDYGIDFEEAENLCKNQKIKGAIIVHPLGVPVNKKKLINLKSKYNLFIIEDCCASVGAKFGDGSNVGTVGEMSSYSFYFGHQLTTIEGGMINTSSSDLYNLLLALRSHGWTKDLSKESLKKLKQTLSFDEENGSFNFIYSGFNLRSTDLQAYLGLKQIDKANDVFLKRNKNHMLYLNNMSKKFSFQKINDCWPVSLHIGIMASSNIHRKNIISCLDENGIENRVWSHGNLGRHNFWSSKYGEFKGKVSNSIYEKCFILPTYPELKEVDIMHIIKVCENAKID
jgi:CDP-6-deoxy-D-xylo-4-hexulose-3-dehydrase